MVAVAERGRVELAVIRSLGTYATTSAMTTPARERVSAYLGYRATAWPASINLHLFVHVRSWTSIRPAPNARIGKQLGMSAQHILREAPAGSGDVRAICDLSGMSASNAIPYSSTINRIR
jgi:hypothetical protein